jgi:hypothetical protein
MPESMVQNIIRHKEEIKEKGKAASLLCGLQTSTWNKSATMIEIHRL